MCIEEWKSCSKMLIVLERILWCTWNAPLLGTMKERGISPHHECTAWSEVVRILPHRCSSYPSPQLLPCDLQHAKNVHGEWLGQLGLMMDIVQLMSAGRDKSLTCDWRFLFLPFIWVFIEHCFLFSVELWRQWTDPNSTDSLGGEVGNGDGPWEYCQLYFSYAYKQIS